MSNWRRGRMTFLHFRVQVPANVILKTLRWGLFLSGYLATEVWEACVGSVSSFACSSYSLVQLLVIQESAVVAVPPTW